MKKIIQKDLYAYNKDKFNYSVNNRRYYKALSSCQVYFRKLYNRLRLNLNMTQYF